jgi:hypothetical protein
MSGLTKLRYTPWLESFGLGPVCAFDSTTYLYTFNIKWLVCKWRVRPLRHTTKPCTLSVCRTTYTICGPSWQGPTCTSASDLRSTFGTFALESLQGNCSKLATVIHSHHRFSSESRRIVESSLDALDLIPHKAGV